MPDATTPPLLYYAFDLISLDGQDYTRQPLVERKAALAELLTRAPEQIRLSASFDASDARVLREMQARGLEGVIAKQRASTYECGQRSGAWTKFKWSLEQEFVIGGFTEPRGSRPYFGALLVGFFEKGALKFASKVGTGFDARLLADLYKRFEPLQQRECSFVNLPETRRTRFSEGLSAAEMKRCTWLQPELVAQIRFTEWTRDSHLRHPVFLGLREDKEAREVVRERPA